MPPNFASVVNDACFKFIWNFKPDKVKRNTLIGPSEKGGLNMVDFTMMDKSLKAAWVRRLHEAKDSKWASIFTSATTQHGGTLLFNCNFDTRDLNFSLHLPSFYKEVLTVWQELHSREPSSAKEYENEIIWNNRFIRINRKPVFYMSWFKNGVTKVSHLLNNNGKFLSRSEFQHK